MTDRRAFCYLEPADAARIVGLSSAAINVHADRGDLRIAARTRRGTRLFILKDVERFAAERVARARLDEECR